MPPYLSVYGQAQQKSKFWAKNIMSWPKMAIFIGPKIFKSGSAERAHRVCHFEVSYAPLAQCMWSGSQKKTKWNHLRLQLLHSRSISPVPGLTILGILFAKYSPKSYHLRISVLRR